MPVGWRVEAGGEEPLASRPMSNSSKRGADEAKPGGPADAPGSLAGKPQGRPRVPFDDLVDPSLAHLLGSLSMVHQRVRDAVQRRRQSDVMGDDPWRGLYVPDELVDQLLRVDPASAALGARSAMAGSADPVLAGADPLPGGAHPAPGTGGPSVLAGEERGVDRRQRAVGDLADRATVAGEAVRLRLLQERFALDDLAVSLWLVAAAPDLDRRFEQLYGYLNDDVTRRRATVGLALELCGVPAVSSRAWQCLGPASALVRKGLLEVLEPERPWLGRELRASSRVVAWCTGDDTPDPATEPWLALVRSSSPGLGAAGARDDGSRTSRGLAPGATALDEDVATAGSAIARAVGATRVLVYLEETVAGCAGDLAEQVWAALGRPCVVCHVEQLDPHHDDDVVAVARLAEREARLAGAGLVVGPVDALAAHGGRHVRTFADLGVGVVLHGRLSWDPQWSAEVPITVRVSPPPPAAQASVWVAALHGADVEPGVDPGAATAAFRLSSRQVRRAATGALHQARLEGVPVDAGHLRAAARAQGGAGLQRLARRIEPAVGWGDLVLTEQAHAHLRELSARARHRELVLRQWRLRPGGGRGLGVVALFAGPSGTGKTMSAEVLAGELGLDLYAVNVATVVDKYIGETEKNLQRIFDEAEDVSGVLLFDEADALFGKRSETRDANDRFANIEVAYLLQQMEQFNGLAVLSTNLRANIDEAFVRRLDAIVEFSLPDQVSRRVLWERCCSPEMPLADDVDFDFCAKAFELSGGSIRSIVVGAAYAAADAGRAVGMADLVRSTQREYAKLGRLCTEADFGPYWSLIGPTGQISWRSPGEARDRVGEGG